LLSGDTILSINGTKVDIWNIGNVLKKYIDKNITLSFLRDKKKMSAQAQCPADNCIL